MRSQRRVSAVLLLVRLCCNIDNYGFGNMLSFALNVVFSIESLVCACAFGHMLACGTPWQLSVHNVMASALPAVT